MPVGGISCGCCAGPLLLYFESVTAWRVGQLQARKIALDVVDDALEQEISKETPRRRAGCSRSSRKIAVSAQCGEYRRVIHRAMSFLLPAKVILVSATSTKIQRSCGMRMEERI